MNGPSAIAARSAIEALRSGVPNRAAIRLLGSDDESLRQDFSRRLGLCDAALRDSGRVEGIILSGAFGAGKSHQLGYLGEFAHQEQFVVSFVPISKETPLFDPARLFAAAIRAAVVPDANDDVMTAVMRRLRPNSDRYDALELWTNTEVREGRLAPVFAALLYLIPRRTTDPEDHTRIARFFGGGRLTVTAVRGWLSTAGAARLFDLKPVREADLALQRVRFAPRLFRASGYSGWCLLLDEVELIGRYSPLQRGRSYAELTRWLGLEHDAAIPGLVTVAAVTDDFSAQMFDEKRDDELIPPRLEERGLIRQFIMAKRGIEWLERRQARLDPPTEAGLRNSLDKIAGFYRDAYGWRPPRLDIGERLAGKSMRQYVKSWITSWDIERLYGQTPQIEAETIATDYSESSEIEQAPADGGEDDRAG
jgi:bacteriophage exclusion system BrxC/D-like protein